MMSPSHVSPACRLPFLRCSGECTSWRHRASEAAPAGMPMLVLPLLLPWFIPTASGSPIGARWASERQSREVFVSCSFFVISPPGAASRQNVEEGASLEIFLLRPHRCPFEITVPGNGAMFASLSANSVAMSEVVEHASLYFLVPGCLVA